MESSERCCVDDYLAAFSLRNDLESRLRTSFDMRSPLSDVIFGILQAQIATPRLLNLQLRRRLAGILLSLFIFLTPTPISVCI